MRTVLPRSNRSTRQPAWLALLVAVVGVVFSASGATAQSASLAELKAAFLFNFSKFIEWPDAAFTDSTTFTIGVIGDGLVVFELDGIVQGKKIGRRDVTLKRLDAKDNPAGVQILFIDAGEHSRLPAILKGTRGAGVLTVSDFEEFCHLGGAIQLQLDHDRMRFDINIAATDQAGLTINSKLLTLARGIIGTRESGGHQ